MRQRWIVKFANLHPKLIPFELQYLLPNAERKKILDVMYEVIATRDEIDNFSRYSSLVRDILNSPRYIGSDILLGDKFPAELIHPIFDDENLFSADMNGSFAVRFKQIGEKNKSMKSPEIERKVAIALFTGYTGYTIDLGDPDYQYHIYAYGDSCVMGWSVNGELIAENTRKLIARGPVRSPYFGGGAMKPHLSRALVNLLHPLDSYVVDPFSGQGGLLREIADMGSTAIGFEINPKISMECRENNYHHGYEDMIFLIVCDSLSPPLRRGIYQFISDPPYSIQTTTIGRGRESLIRSWLSNQEVGTSFVFCTPGEMLNKLPGDWELIIDTDDYVHKALTRRIRKIKRRRK